MVLCIYKLVDSEILKKKMAEYIFNWYEKHNEYSFVWFFLEIIRLSWNFWNLEKREI